MTENKSTQTPQVSSTSVAEQAAPATTPASIQTSTPAPETTASAAPEMSLADELRANIAEQESKLNPKAATPTKEVKKTLEPGEEAPGEETEVDPSQEVEPTADDKELEATVEREFPLVPENFSPKERELFEKALNSDDPFVQELAASFIDRYNGFKSGFTKKTQAYAAKMKEVDVALKDVDPLLAQNKLSRGKYLENLVSWDKVISQNPAEGIKRIMQNFKVTPEMMGFTVGKQKQVSKPFNIDEELTNTSKSVNPKISELETRNKLLQNQVENLPVQIQIRQFAEATDNEDKLLHPHFEKVRPTMAALITADGNLTLKQAYLKALKVDGVATENKQSNTSQDINKIREKIKKAQTAGRSVKANSGSVNVEDLSLRDELALHIKNAG